MKRYIRKTQSGHHVENIVTLTYADRIKSRLRITQQNNGEEAGIYLTRGSILHHGDILTTEDRELLVIHAADEKVSTVSSRNPHLRLRACYHLGNRHVPLQIENEWVRYLHDHVLDDMLLALGLEVNVEMKPFHPESGAYHNGQHHHLHQH